MKAHRTIRSRRPPARAARAAGVAALLSSLVVAPAIPAETRDGLERVARYILTHEAAASEEPLASVVSPRFPPEVRSVGEAMEHALSQSGFLLDWDASDDAARALKDRPLPSVHRELGKMSLLDVVKTLAGRGWEVSADHAGRVLTLHLSRRRALVRDAFAVAGGVAHKAGLGDLSEPIAVHHDSIQLRDLLTHLIPDGWELRLEIPKREARQVIAFHAETSRRRALDDLLKKLNLRGSFYPGAGLLLVSKS